MEQKMNLQEETKTEEVQLESQKKSSELDKKNRKKIIVAAMCLVVIGILIFVLSFMKYMTPEMRGKVAYEPALFNTVLLGELAEKDSLAKADPGNGEKISQSLNLSRANEFGTSLASESSNNIKKVGPGTSTALYFTVTNGTTLEEKDNGSTDTQDADSSTGQGQNTNKKVNVAQCDIKYKIHIITTNNLPLSFSLKDLSNNQGISLTKADQNDDTLGNVDDYIVSSETDGFEDGKRILKLQKDAITVHRYQLNVSWDAKDADGNVIPDKTDIKYMKELENIEVRLEVESYVNHLNQTTSNTLAKGILTLDKENAEDSYFTANLGDLFAQKTVRYENFGSSALASEKIPKNVEVGTTGKAYAYDFTVYNGTTASADWMNGEGDSHGYYLRHYSGLTGGTYKVAVAVPTGKAGVGTDRSKADEYAYYLKMGDTIYPLTAATNTDGTKKTTTTRVWEKKEKGNQKHVYDYKDTTEEAYQILIPESEINLSYDAGEFSGQDLTLYMVDKTGNGYQYQTNDSTKDDFRIYVYR